MANKEYIKAWNKAHREHNNVLGRAAFLRRRKNDFSYRLFVSAYSRIETTLKRSKIKKEKGMVISLLGCDRSILWEHIKRQLDEGMSAYNYGKISRFSKTWCMDHRNPLCSFDLNDLDQRKSAFHYSNIRPMWAHDNLKKLNDSDKNLSIREKIVLFGELNPAAKLTRESVLAIRSDERLYKEIAESYGIKYQQVSRIKRRERWGHL